MVLNLLGGRSVREAFVDPVLQEFVHALQEIGLFRF
jgi:hypothetical protein